MKHVVDSSAWLEYFADGPNAEVFAPVIEAPDGLLIPVVTLFEVFKHVVQQRDEHMALACVALMQRGTVVDMDATLALETVSLSMLHKVPLAGSLVYATARRGRALLWTQDSDFNGLDREQTLEGL